MSGSFLKADITEEQFRWNFFYLIDDDMLHVWKQPEQSHIEGIDYAIDAGMKNGGAEIKANYNGNLYYGNNPEQHVFFEVFQRVYDSKQGRYVVTEDKGSLWHLFHPEHLADEKNAAFASDGKRLLSSKPLKYVCLYYQCKEREITEYSVPICAIVIEDVDQLFTRLRLYAKEDYGVDLDKGWFSYPADSNTNRKKYRTWLMSNLWNIPLKQLEDIVSVTMCGDDVEPSGYVARRRYQYLKELAARRGDKQRISAYEWTTKNRMFQESLIEAFKRDTGNVKARVNFWKIDEKMNEVFNYCGMKYIVGDDAKAAMEEMLDIFR